MRSINGFSPITWLPRNTRPNNQLIAVGFHWMKTGLLNARVAPPRTISRPRVMSGIFSTLRTTMAAPTTGVAAVSVARGAIGNPLIFRQAREHLAGREPRAPGLHEIRDVLLEHAELAQRLYRSDQAGRLVRKFALRAAPARRA